MGEGEKRAAHLKWHIVTAPTALRLIKSISDRQTREKIANVIERLAVDPGKQGKDLLRQKTIDKARCSCDMGTLND